VVVIVIDAAAAGGEQERDCSRSKKAAATRVEWPVLSVVPPVERVGGCPHPVAVARIASLLRFDACRK
jgi:hypothetical protein